jgi:hypothetical protein
MTEEAKKLPIPVEEVLRLLGPDLVRLAKKLFGSSSAKVSIVVFGLSCLGYPLFRIVEAYWVTDDILVSMPLAYLMVVGVIALRAAHRWGKTGGDR